MSTRHHSIELSDGEYAELARAVTEAERRAEVMAHRAAEGSGDTMWAETVEDLASLGQKIRGARSEALRAG